MRRQILLVSSLFLATVTVSFADAVVGNFNLDTSLNSVPSQGQVTFTLNGDGTIAASLVTYNNTIFGFGFNSAVSDLPESNFSSAPDNPYGWSDSFGSHPSGFACYLTDACGFAESWTIDFVSVPYTSVSQVLDGGSQSSVAFFLYDSKGGEYGAQVPEPSSRAYLAVYGTGLLGALGALTALRRRLFS